MTLKPASLILQLATEVSCESSFLAALFKNLGDILTSPFFLTLYIQSFSKLVVSEFEINSESDQLLPLHLSTHSSLYSSSLLWFIAVAYN